MKFKGKDGRTLRVQEGYYINFIDSSGSYWSYTIDQVELIPDDKKQEVNGNMDIVKGYIDDLRFLSKLKEENRD